MHEHDKKNFRNKSANHREERKSDDSESISSLPSSQEFSVSKESSHPQQIKTEAKDSPFEALADIDEPLSIKSNNKIMGALKRTI